MEEYFGILEYQIRAKSVIFHCTGLAEGDRYDKNNSAVGELLNDFLLELSENRKVIFMATVCLTGR